MYRANQRPFWEKVDWTKRDCELIHSLNRPKDMVRYWREVLGKPKVKIPGKPLFPTRLMIQSDKRRKRAIELYNREGMTYKKVAKIIGVSTGTVGFLIQKPKWAARKILNRNVRLKTIGKKFCCEVCGSKPKHIHGHHRSYEEPLKVMWICPACHGALHRMIRIIKRTIFHVDT